MSTTRRAKQQRTAPAVDPIAISSATLAAMLQTSKATIFRRLALGQLPKPIGQFGQQPRWDAEEIRAWVKAGMPDQRAWEAMKSRTK